MKEKKQIYRDYPMSQREIAKVLNISAMSVYEIEKQALKKRRTKAQILLFLAWEEGQPGRQSNSQSRWS